ncbi:pre-mRNA-splicing factor 38B-like [Aplysia californica]|uniref:Pre-mRNA-splicing factor 38B-like n=1 Tax=Aplysia californica TaxID=6500 RepID=A0ABM1W1Z1_APLCA|nr:pre-mRNA-splicing factor 38B-like [Aplysia californica]
MSKHSMNGLQLSVNSVVNVLIKKHDSRGLSLKEIKQELVKRKELPLNATDSVLRSAIRRGIRTRRIKKVRFQPDNRNRSGSGCQFHKPDLPFHRSQKSGGQDASKEQEPTRHRSRSRGQHQHRHRVSSSPSSVASLDDRHHQGHQKWPRSESRREIMLQSRSHRLHMNRSREAGSGKHRRRRESSGSRNHSNSSRFSR